MKRAMTRTLCLAMLTASAVAQANTLTDADSFYAYDGKTPLTSIVNGTPLKTRELTYYMPLLHRSFNVVQILYKTSNGKMQPTVNVTSVIKSAFGLPGGIISYQSAYDSLNPLDSPSWKITSNQDLAGAQSITGALAGLAGIEIKAVIQLSDLGFNVVIPDTEGETADFADGPEEGMTTLDSIQAALNTPSTGLNPRAGAIMMGYSGGAIATDWAAQLAPSYAPALNKNNLLGASIGGLLIDPVHNLQYVDGGAQWGGVAPMALIGMARGHGLDLTSYLNGAGLTNYYALQSASLYGELKQYQGLHWEDWLLPQYLADWNNYLVTGTFSPVFNQYAIVANAEDLGTMPAPTIPVHFVQGNNGTAANKNGSTRPGDGVMLADDARTLVKQFCDQGTQVHYHEVALNHAGAAAVWAEETAVFVAKRFARLPIITTCNSIPPGGTSLTPIPLSGGS